MACAAARAFSLSLLESRCGSAVDGAIPTSAEVVAASVKWVACEEFRTVSLFGFLN